MRHDGVKPLTPQHLNFNYPRSPTITIWFP